MEVDDSDTKPDTTVESVNNKSPLPFQFLTINFLFLIKLIFAFFLQK
jgi:hypothetical protein